MSETEYDLAKKRLLDKCAELKVAIRADADTPIVSELRNGDSLLDRMLAKYFASVSREHTKKLLDNTFQPQWHFIEFTSLGERAIRGGYDIYNCAQSQQMALGFVLRQLADSGLSVQTVFEEGIILVQCNDGDLARITPIAYKVGDSTGSRRVTRALKHLHEYTPDAKITARLKQIPGLGQRIDRDRNNPYPVDIICIHKTANNFAQNMKIGIQELCNGQSLPLNIAQELTAVFMGADSWQHLKAAENNGKAIEAPYLLLQELRTEKHQRLGFYRSKPAGIWAYALLLHSSRSRDYWCNDTLSYFSNAPSTTQLAQPEEELTLWQLEDESENDGFTLLAERQIKTQQASGVKILSITPNELLALVDVDANHITRCPLCDYNYAQDQPEDRAEHQAYHNECKKVEGAFGLILLHEKEQESDKKLAYKQLKNDDSAIQREGALRLINAHYHRSLYAAISRGDWSEHPVFGDYVAMVDDYKPHIPTHTMTDLRKQYGHMPGHIEEGSSYWRPQSKVQLTETTQ